MAKCYACKKFCWFFQEHMRDPYYNLGSKYLPPIQDYKLPRIHRKCLRFGKSIRITLNERFDRKLVDIMEDRNSEESRT